MQRYRLNETIVTAGLKVKDVYRPAEVGQILDCSISSVYRLIKNGLLVSRRLGQGKGHYRIDRMAISEYLSTSTLHQE